MFMGEVLPVGGRLSFTDVVLRSACAPRWLAAALAWMGIPREKLLHVAQSLFHDHVPAKSRGMTSI